MIIISNFSFGKIDGLVVMMPFCGTNLGSSQDRCVWFHLVCAEYWGFPTLLEINSFPAYPAASQILVSYPQLLRIPAGRHQFGSHARCCAQLSALNSPRLGTFGRQLNKHGLFYKFASYCEPVTNSSYGALTHARRGAGHSAASDSLDVHSCFSLMFDD